MKRRVLFLLIVAVCSTISLAGCKSTPDIQTPKQPKYVFLFIGDGMGLAHVTATEDYLAAKQGRHGSDNLSFTQFPVFGLVTTYSANTLVTCSSAAATALATGYKTNNGMLGVDSTGKKLIALTYPLHNAGYKIGIATSVSVDHATPAGFYANAASRSSYYDIASQVSTSGFDFFAGSGFLEPGEKGAKEPDVFTKLTDAGYQIVRGPEAAAQVSASSGKTVLIQAEGKPADALPYAIDRKSDDLTLAQITQAAISALYNEKGFFAMIEGGKIDWAAHTNDGATVVNEVADFSNAVQIAVDFYKQHPDETLILVTSDHETGGMSVGCCGVYAFNPLAFDAQTASLPYQATGKEIDFVKKINENAHCGWTSKNHTGIMVPIYAIGAGSENFSGKMDNTDVLKRVVKMLGVIK